MIFCFFRDNICFSRFVFFIYVVIYDIWDVIFHYLGYHVDLNFREVNSIYVFAKLCKAILRKYDNGGISLKLQVFLTICNAPVSTA